MAIDNNSVRFTETTKESGKTNVHIVLGAEESGPLIRSLCWFLPSFVLIQSFQIAPSATFPVVLHTLYCQGGPVVCLGLCTCNSDIPKKQ